VDQAEFFFILLPLSLTSLALTIPAWYMAHGDLRAIRAGAMDPQGRRATRIAYALGCVGALISLLPAIGGIVSLLLSLFE
jgi:hypothetical protein